MRLSGPLLALAALLALTAAAYLPGLPGDFVLDDRQNITNNAFVAVERLDAESLRGAMHAYPAALPWPSRGLAYVSFALNYRAAGGVFDPADMKLTNIAIHLVNGGLVYLLVTAAMRARAGPDAPRTAARWTAAIAAGLWLLHPLQLTAVLYSVQRMTSLSALFVLLGLVVYCAGRARLARRPAFGASLMVLGVAGGTLLGMLCKENAVLTPLFALLLELWFFSLPGRTGGAERRRLAIFHGVTVGLPGVLALGVLAVHGERLLSGYAFRSFDVVERLLTQGRVLLYYLRWFVLPRTRDLGLYHDDIALSTGLFTPWTTAPALALWALALGLVVATFRRRALLGFCVLWFLAGHLVESTILPLELAFEHRNYLPLLGPCLALAWLLVSAVERALVPARAAAMLAVGALALLAFVTQTRAGIWQDENTLAYFQVRNHPDSYRAKTGYARMLVRRGVDARETWTALARAAADEARPVAALLEMVKVAREMQIRVASGEIEEDAQAGAPPADWTQASLRYHRGYLEQVEAVLVEELERRLRELPLSYETVNALQSLRECLLQGAPACRSLGDEARRWLRLAMQNPRSVPATMAAVEYGYAVLLAEDGREEEAARLASSAWERVPRQLGFGFYKGYWLMKAGRLDEAERVVEHMEAFERRTGRRGDEVRALREAFDDARREARDAP